MSETSDGYTEINGLSHLEPDYSGFCIVDFFKELPHNIYGVDWGNKLELHGQNVWTASCFCFLWK
ncbi:hypothetical protein D8674_028802 [Pyrus ussuriensis x Pyrus communis]|uniref:Uncharacterized protein n=1 Tax=Pyrus ussuriensis x Pyrus communis TaxID=2448454 RepID=A0A5N5HXC6_9ROSA|nr:hypothetical protein D8674_028802 [Pyrus ussuriensis x Pyrus communis]